MTLSSETVKVQYSGNGSTTAFAVSFIFWDDDDLRVIHRSAAGVETVWTRGTQYTVTGGNGTTGTLNVSTSPTDYTPASGTTLTIKSALADTQPTDLPLGGAFPSATVEEQLDKTVRLVQQKEERLNRAILLQETSTASDITVPDPEAGTVLRWNAAETGLENATITGDGDITIPVPISQGGTGATTAATAFTALKQAASETATGVVEIANQAEAEAGASSSVVMTPQRTSQAITALQTAAASQAEMESASSTTKYVTPGRTQYHPGVAKGWAAFTPAAALDGTPHNVSSITDDGTGQFTVNWGTDFASADYAAAVSIDIGGSGTLTRININTKAAGTLSVATTNNTPAATEADVAIMNAIGFGDQA